MKIKTLFTISILVLAVLIITGSCITLLTPLLHLQAEKGNLLRVKKVNRGRGGCECEKLAWMHSINGGIEEWSYRDSWFVHCDKCERIMRTLYITASRMS